MKVQSPKKKDEKNDKSKSIPCMYLHTAVRFTEYERII